MRHEKHPLLGKFGCTSLLVGALLACAGNISEDGQSSAALAQGESLLGTTTPAAANRVEDDAAAVELGVKFQSTLAGKINAIRFYRGEATSRGYRVHLWSANGTLLGSGRGTDATLPGWQTIALTTPVSINANTGYVASYYAASGDYASTQQGFAQGITRSHLSAPAQAGVYRYGASGFPTSVWHASNYWVDVSFLATGTTPPPPVDAGTPPPPPVDAGTPPPPPVDAGTPSKGFPDDSNTGVPAGVTLTKYTGPCTWRSGSPVLDKVDATSCGALALYTGVNLTITNSRIPRIDATNGGSVSVSDSTIIGGDWVEGVLWGSNITATRVNVTGGQHSVHCENDCTLVDSYLHDQYNPAGQAFHNNAFITNGGNNMVIRHNTLYCSVLQNSSGGGCTGDMTLLGDFDTVSNVLVENNLLKANNSSISFCGRGGWEPSKAYPIPNHITYSGNVFERGPNGKCGVYGPMTSWYDGNSDVWSNNTWDDGTVLNP